MYRSILVPLDGSTFSEHSLPLALSIAQKAGATVTLLHVHSPLSTVYLEGAAYLDNTLDEDIKAQHQSYLNMIAERIKASQPSMNIPKTKLVVGDVSSTVSHEAAQCGADLVVMTTHGRGPMGRFWLGSVADELVRQLPMPLLLIHPHKELVDLQKLPEFKQILIPLDGSELAERIIPAAVALGRPMNASYVLARIIKPVLPYDSPAEIMTMSAAVKSVLDRVEELQKQLRDEAQSYLDKVAERLRGEGLQVSTRVDIEMQPAAGILHDAEETHVDLIAVETHGRHGLSRLFLGSVSDKIVRGAKVPVLVHKPA